MSRSFALVYFIFFNVHLLPVWTHLHIWPCLWAGSSNSLSKTWPDMCSKYTDTCTRPDLYSYLHRCHLWVCGFLRRKNTLVAKLMWACNYLFAGRCVIVWDICVNSSLTKHISHTYIHSRHRIILYFKSVKPLLQLTSIKLFNMTF